MVKAAEPHALDQFRGDICNLVSGFLQLSLDAVDGNNIHRRALTLDAHTVFEWKRERIEAMFAGIRHLASTQMFNRSSLGTIIKTEAKLAMRYMWDEIMLLATFAGPKGTVTELSPLQKKVRAQHAADGTSGLHPVLFQSDPSSVHFLSVLVLDEPDDRDPAGARWIRARGAAGRAAAADAVLLGMIMAYERALAARASLPTVVDVHLVAICKHVATVLYNDICARLIRANNPLLNSHAA